MHYVENYLLNTGLYEKMTQSNCYLKDFADLANAEGCVDAQLPLEIGVKHWSMDKGKTINYQKDDSHTLSIYLHGGEKNFRSDRAGYKGAPGKICLMPQGHNSEWQINGKVEFVHLYFSDLYLKRYAASTFELDVRMVDLDDLLFQDDKKLRALLIDNFIYCRELNSLSPLYAETSTHKIMHHLLSNYNIAHLSSNRVSSGLSPFNIKLCREAINDGLEEKLTIEKLADKTQLSPFHFARMFKLSFGESPANYITRTRIDKIKQLLNEPLTLAEISLKVGFNQQSHMTQNFKRFTGLTPAVYRSRLIN